MFNDDIILQLVLNKNGNTLVLIHGSNGSLFNFESMNKFLIDDFRIVSLDLPAHGLTGPVNSNYYSFDGFIRVINEILEIKKINQFFLAGHSMGGRVVWNYTIDYPEKVSGLIIIGSLFLANEEEYTEFQSGNAPPIVFKLLEIPFFRAKAAICLPTAEAISVLLDCFSFEISLSRDETDIIVSPIISSINWA